MRETRILYFALGVLVVASVGAVSLHDTGVEFPDGSFQETAAAVAAKTAVQGKASLFVTGLVECTNNATLYSVPANKRLVIQWLSIQSELFGGVAGTHPVRVDITVHNGVSSVNIPIARLEDPLVVGTSFFLRSTKVLPVTLYSEANQPVTVRMCFNANLEDEGAGTVSFSGFLVDV